MKKLLEAKANVNYICKVRKSSKLYVAIQRIPHSEYIDACKAIVRLWHMENR